MVKRGALSKVDKYYIEGNADMPVEDIAKELDRSVNQVTKHLDTLPKAKPTKTKSKTKPKAKKEEPRMFQVMARKERNGEKVATAMTAAASELADATRPKRVMNKKLQQAIHKPKG